MRWNTIKNGKKCFYRFGTKGSLVQIQSPRPNYLPTTKPAEKHSAGFVGSVDGLAHVLLTTRQIRRESGISQDRQEQGMPAFDTAQVRLNGHIVTRTLHAGLVRR